MDFKANDLILAEDKFYSMNCYETKLNNNVLVVGTSGSGKTRSIVTPNLLQATGSYVVSDPKGNLYKKYKGYLEGRGYRVKRLDLVHPERSDHYNFFEYIKSERDILKVSHMLVGKIEEGNHDHFWDHSAEIMVSALISYLLEFARPEERTLKHLLKLVNNCKGPGSRRHGSIVEKLMEEAKNQNPNSFAVKQFEKVDIAPEKTYECILVTIEAKLGMLECDSLQQMTSGDDFDFSSIGCEKTAVFVVVSDTDRSLDRLANIFFSQAMNELCHYADEECEDNRLPLDVRFIMDDFATNVVIDEFPRMISSIRSRGISTMLMIQAESQLQNTYGTDGRTIIANCDTYVYLGGNDVETAESVSKRCNMLLEKVLYMPVGNCWIFRRGEKPSYSRNFDLDTYFERQREEMALC